MKYRITLTSCIIRIFLVLLVISSPMATSAQEQRDSLQTSISFNISFGMMRDQGLDAISFLSSYNPSYNLKYNRFELGLGLDYYRYTIRLPEAYSAENIYSFSTFLRCYFFKKQYLYAEFFLLTGYWDSKGELDVYEGDQFISTFGPGIGIVLPPMKRHRDHKFLKNVYYHLNYRYSLIHRDILILEGDANIGLIYKF